MYVQPARRTYKLTSTCQFAYLTGLSSLQTEAIHSVAWLYNKTRFLFTDDGDIIASIIDFLSPLCDCLYSTYTLRY